VYAGTDDIGNGGTALSARLQRINSGTGNQIIASVANGDVFVSDGSRTIRRISAIDGIITRYLDVSGSILNVPGFVSSARIPSMWNGAINMVSDGQHFIYVVSNSRIYRINTKNDTIEYYAGGGSGTTNGSSALDASIADYSRLAINPLTGDIFYLSQCSEIEVVRIFKMSQNSNGSAGTIEHVAGACSTGIPGNNIDARDSALIRQILFSAISQRISMTYAYGVHALYLEIYAPTGTYFMKIVDGKIFSTNGIINHSLTYSHQHNRVYRALHSFTPTANLSIETFNTELGNSPNEQNCDGENTYKSQACLMLYSFSTLPNGDLMMIDGLGDNMAASFRIRTLGTDGNIRTIAGVKKISGHNSDASVARFVAIHNLRYKSTSLGNSNLFPSGLYYGDGEAATIGRIDPTNNKMIIMGGRQVSQALSNGVDFGFEKSMGTFYNSQSAGFFNFTPAGLLNFYSQGSHLFRVGTDGKIYFVTGGSTNFINATAGIAATSVDVRHHGARAGITFDQSGRLYSGSRSSADNGAKLYVINVTNNTFHPVIGSSTVNASSADDSTAGSAITKSISCTIDISRCYPQYDDIEDRLLFSEGNTIRFVSTPYDSSQSTLGTLSNTDVAGAAMNAGRSIHAFVYEAEKDRVYYMSGGQLYCYDLLQNSPAHTQCNNSALTFPSQMGTLTNFSLALGSNNEVYVTSGSVIYKYQFPN
jgi:hypothetical protein